MKLTEGGLLEVVQGRMDRCRCPACGREFRIPQPHITRRLPPGHTPGGTRKGLIRSLDARHRRACKARPMCQACGQRVAALFPVGTRLVCAECSQRPLGPSDMGTGAANPDAIIVDGPHA